MPVYIARISSLSQKSITIPVFFFYQQKTFIAKLLRNGSTDSHEILCAGRVGLRIDKHIDDTIISYLPLAKM